MVSSNESKYSQGANRIFGASLPRYIVQEIDVVRGDTARSLWLRRAAVKELEIQKRKQKKREKPQ